MVLPTKFNPITKHSSINQQSTQIHTPHPESTNWLDVAIWLEYPCARVLVDEEGVCQPHEGLEQERPYRGKDCDNPGWMGLLENVFRIVAYFLD